MAITVASLAKNVAETTIQWHEDTVTVQYRPGLLTTARIDSMVEEEYGLQSFLAMVVIGWDVTEKVKGKNAMFPLDIERLKELPSPFMRAIMRGMLMDGSDMGEAPSTSSGG